MRDDRARLQDILEAIQRLEHHVTRPLSQLSPMEISGVVWHLQLIGEASAKLSAPFREKHSNVAWQKIIRSRNIFVHHYFDVDFEIVQTILTLELPRLKSQILCIIDSETTT